MTVYRWLPMAIFIAVIISGPFSVGNAQDGGFAPASYTFQQGVNQPLNRPLMLIEPADGTGRHFVIQQSGLIRIVINGVVQTQPFLDIQAIVNSTANEQGLLGMAFHPNFPTTPYFFVNYTDVNGDTIVARYSVSAGNPNAADPASRLEFLKVLQPATNHNGGMLQFGPDGYLYIGMGDGGGAGDPQENGQNPFTLLGSILRIDINNPSPPKQYSIPPNNPYANGVNGAPEIWAWGLRNPWRFSFDRRSGEMYIGDVGQDVWEEIDINPAGMGGLNFGWDAFEGSSVFEGNPNGAVVMPVAEYNHSQGCSVTGGYVYHGNELPEFQGSYFYGDYCSGIIWRLYRGWGGGWVNELFMDTNYRIVSFAVDLEGELYLLDRDGLILKLVKINEIPNNRPR